MFLFNSDFEPESISRSRSETLASLLKVIDGFALKLVRESHCISAQSDLAKDDCSSLMLGSLRKAMARQGDILPASAGNVEESVIALAGLIRAALNDVRVLKGHNNCNPVAILQDRVLAICRSRKTALNVSQYKYLEERRQKMGLSGLKPILKNGSQGGSYKGVGII